MARAARVRTRTLHRGRPTCNDGWAYVTGSGSAQRVDLMVSTETGQWDAVPLDLHEDLSDGVAIVGEDGGLILAERDTGRAWQIEHVADLLAQRAAAAADTT